MNNNINYFKIPVPVKNNLQRACSSSPPRQSGDLSH